MMNDKDLNSKSMILSVYKACKILELFGESDSMNFAEISSKLDLPTATLYRFLSTLTLCGLLDLDAKSKLYTLGPSMIYLGSVAIASVDIIKIAHPYMEKLKEETNETISLFVRRGFKKICIDKVESDHTIKYSAKIGKANYLHGGASGNVLMSGMSKKEIDALEASVGFPQLTQYTITDRKSIDAALEKTRRDGCWVSYKERSDDTAGIGVPIYNHLGQVAASLNITLPSIRFDEAAVPKWLSLLKEAGAEISKKNGYIQRLNK